MIDTRTAAYGALLAVNSVDNQNYSTTPEEGTP